MLRILLVLVSLSFFRRTGVVNAVYESRPMMEDHKQDLKDLAAHGNPQFWEQHHIVP